MAVQSEQVSDLSNSLPATLGSLPTSSLFLFWLLHFLPILLVGISPVLGVRVFLIVGIETIVLLFLVEAEALGEAMGLLGERAEVGDRLAILHRQTLAHRLSRLEVEVLCGAQGKAHRTMIII
jgi:hypothetical protein